MTRNDLTLDEWNDQDYLDDRDYQDENTEQNGFLFNPQT